MGQHVRTRSSSPAAVLQLQLLAGMLLLLPPARCLQPALSASSGMSSLPESMAVALEHQPRHLSAALHGAGNVSPVAVTRRSLSGVAFPTSLPPAEKYLQFLGCQDFSSQLQCLLDGLVLGKLLEVTVVLPVWYSSYDSSDLAQAHTPASNARYDTQGRNAVPMSRFWDVDALIAALAGSVKVVKELPAYLQGDPEGTYIVSETVDPATTPRSLHRLQSVLARRQVLRLACVMRKVKYTTKEVGAFTAAVLASLKPSQEVADGAAKQLQAINGVLAKHSLAPLAPGGYAAVQLRVGADWRAYCRGQAEKFGKDMVEPCSMGAAQVAAVVAASMAPAAAEAKQGLGDVLYVATGLALEPSDAGHLLSAGAFKAVAGPQSVCVRSAPDAAATCEPVPDPQPDMPKELATGVALQVLLGGKVVYGNVYSWLSWWVRLLKYAARDPLEQPNDVIYYNVEPHTTALDMSRAESLRYGIFGGILKPWLYQHPSKAPRTHALLALLATGKCRTVWEWAPECGAPPEAQGLSGPAAGNLVVSKVDFEGSAVTVTGKVTGQSPVGFYHTVNLYINGLVKRQVVACRHGLDTPEEVSHFEVLTGVGVPPGMSRFVTVQACVISGGRDEVCSERQNVYVRPDTTRFLTGPQMREDVAPVLYFTIHRAPRGVFMPGGGRASIHQLHSEVNKWHASGQLAVRSVLLGGLETYKMPYANYSRVLMDETFISPRDYFLAPDKHFHLPRWHGAAESRTGALTLVYFLGHFFPRLEGLLDRQGYKPLCRTHFLGLLFNCPPKSMLIAPMGPEIYTAAEQHRRLAAKPPRENIVLMDPDPTANFNFDKLQLPPGTRLIMLDRMTKDQVLNMYARAKVYIDSYMTGIERQIMESALFGVLPIVAYHGNGIDSRDFPIPMRWRWQPHNYTQLNELIATGINSYEASVADFHDLRAHTRSLPNSYGIEVQRYFQDDVHFMLAPYAQGGLQDVRAGAAAAAAVILNAVNYPFATHEVAAPNLFYWSFDYSALLRDFQLLGLMQGITRSPLQAEVKRFKPQFGVYVQGPRAKHFRTYQVLLPAGILPVHPALIRAMFKAAHTSNKEVDVVVGPDDILLVRYGPYYDAVPRVLPYLPDDAELGDLLAGLEVAGLRHTTLQPAAWRDEQPELGLPESCTAATVTLFEPLPPEARCLCGHLEVLLMSRQVTQMVGKVPPELKELHQWFKDVAAACGWRGAGAAGAA